MPAQEGSFQLINYEYQCFWANTFPKFTALYYSHEIGKPIVICPSGSFTLMEVIYSCVSTLTEFHKQESSIHLDCRLPNFVFNSVDGKLLSSLIDFEMTKTEQCNKLFDVPSLSKASQVPPRLRMGKHSKITDCTIMEDFYVFFHSLIFELFQYFGKKFHYCSTYDDLSKKLDTLLDLPVQGVSFGVDFISKLKVLIRSELDNVGDTDSGTLLNILETFEKKVELFYPIISIPIFLMVLAFN
ncbi:hypothetical protein GEMRC1_009513 [Eukaryota sp. GEM-RC1]